MIYRYYAGGIVGSISNTGASVMKCQNNGNVNANLYYVGGIAGRLYSESIVSECENSGDITGVFEVGGIIGHSDGNSEKCKNSGVIKSDYMAGGIAGFAKDLSYCSNYGNIISVNQNLSGLKYNPIRSSENTFDYSVTGGLVGYFYNNDMNSDSITISDSYNRGNINGKGYVGGLIGRISGITNISNCYTASDLVNADGRDEGGLIGSLISKGQTTIDNCYFLSSNSSMAIAYGNTKQYGTAKSASNMKKNSFAEALGSKYIAVNDNYPVLFWEALKPKLSIDKKELTLSEFKETAKINCNTNYNGELTWKSSDDKIATIDENGMVTARKNGTCIITVDAGGSSASCEVTVDYGYYFNESSMTLMPGLSKGLVVYSKNTRKPADVDIQFFSSDSTVASVSKQGVVTANATGNTSVNAYVGEAILVCQVNVREVKGDINGDSKFNVQDLVALQKLFYASDDIDPSAATFADFNNDGRINIIDMCLMKADLISRE